MRRYAYLLFLPLLLIASACRQQQAAQKAQVFRLNLSSGSLESLDPAYAKDLYTMWTTHMLYNTLVATDSSLMLQPSLARSWEISDDGLQYTFHLRQGVLFHPDTQFGPARQRKMIAADVVYSFRRLIDPATASPGAWIFNGHISGPEAFSARDDSTFVMTLEAAFRPMLAMLSMPYCSIVPREVAGYWGKDFRSHPCGTGPFRFNQWDEGNALLLRRNEAYWEQDSLGHSLPYLDAVQISFYDSKATEFLLFLQQRLDFTHGLDGSFKDLILRKDGTLKPGFSKQFHMQKSKYLNTEYLGFLTDTSSPLLRGSALKDKRVRQAINLAIDRQRIITYFKNGIGIPATGGFTPPGIAGFGSVVPYGYDYDPARAAALLREAGYPGGQNFPPITILCPENFADIVNFVASELQEIGIPARIEVMQPNILKQQMSRSQAVFFRAQWIADYPDAETYLAFFNSQFPAPPNYTRYRNPKFDALYARSMNEADSLRWQLYRQMDSMAIADAPLVPLFYDQMLHFTQNNISGFSSNPMNLIELKQVRINK